ncbi:MAG: D-alanine--D-alanine ligase family protein [Eubacteriaceae bacterium]|nr:D-alanine--D-alanine ligase family protein [Eubacteriaceae bacterium]
MSYDKKTLLVIFGGTSPEHEVSCKSAAAVLNVIDRTKYDVLQIGITKEGKWILTGADTEKIENGTWEKGMGCKPAAITPDRTVHGIRVGRGKEIRVDCVFPILHGEGGEDGHIQGLLELADIPYVGCGVLASACGMDKGITKALVLRTGIRQAKHCETNRYAFSSNPTEELKKIAMTFHGAYPLFVKPAGTGSSVGVSKVHNDKELFEGIKKAAEADHKVIIETAVVGRELEVGVIGNRDPKASPIGEIQAAAEYYDYKSKYESEETQTSIVTDLPPTKECEIQDAAVTIYKTLSCKGLARVDFFLTEDDAVVFNEINTMPGFTKVSMYSQMWAAAGLEYSELIDRLIDLAMEEI